MMKNKEKLVAQATDLLKKLIETSSFSREEEHTAEILKTFLEQENVRDIHQQQHNVWAYNKFFDASKPTILLNSHHDTVKPNTGYTRNPFEPTIEDNKLYGLGSNDAGGCLVSLLMTFLYYYDLPDLKYNLCFLASAEEEVSGKNGVESVIDQIKNIEFAIIGEPTLLDLAIAEKGLMVLDCTAHGISGHAAREEGNNAIYLAMDDIEWFRDFSFEKESSYLGPIKMSVTMIQAGSQHNVVPATCEYVVDVRTTDAYTNEETLAIIQSAVNSEVKARSTRLRSSSIDFYHPIVQAGIALGKKTYGSPTMSDQALIPFPSLKMGPGDSARSHMADEFIYLQEIEDGVLTYIELLSKIV